MNRARRTCWFAILIFAGRCGACLAQVGGAVQGNRFELSDAVQLNLADNAAIAQLEKTKTLLADRQWDEAVETLRRVAESSDEKLINLPGRRYVTVRRWCQSRLAALPPEALRLYRRRVDPVSMQWYERGLAQRDRALLEDVVHRTFAGSYGDKSLMALGELALESGDFPSAKACWERIVREYPDSSIDPANIRARLILASILEGSTDQARSDLAEFLRLHPDASGKLGGRDGKLADLLKTMLAESESWPAERSNPDWTTFAGNSERNKTAQSLDDVGAPAWRVRLRPEISAADRRTTPNPSSENRREPLSFFPALDKDRVFLNDGRRILALRLDTGRPAWGNTPAIYQSELSDTVPQSVPSDAIGLPRFTVTVFGDKLFARVGSPLTGPSHNAGATERPGSLICLDLAAEGRLLWKIEPEAGWAFEGSPVADDRGVYAAMRRHDVRPQAFAACFDPQTGRMRWRRFICGAETPARGALCEAANNLLTLAGDSIYYNTNLGAVASLDAANGKISWVALYPRDRRGTVSKLAPHWRRDLNPCLFHRGTLYVAPADSPRVFALDAATGRAIWQTGDAPDDAAGLLGVAGQWLIAGGQRLYWISLRDEDRGRIKHVWPDGPERPGYGRGVLAGQDVLWTTRDMLFVFDCQTARPLKTVDLPARGASGGNLLAAGQKLLIATPDELIAVDQFAVKSGKMEKPIISNQE